MPVLPLLVLTLFLEAGCAPETTREPLPLEAPAGFSLSGEAEVPDRWWRVFEDRELSEFVGEALDNNFDLMAAWQRLREARALAKRQRAGLFPELDAFGDAELRRTSYRGGDTEELALGLAASYELDLWGRIGSEAEAAGYRASASYEDYRTAALSLSAEVVRTWFALSALRERIRIIDEQMESNGQVLGLLEDRFELGQARRVDILRQRQLLESTRELKLAAEAEATVLENRLMVLIGSPPGGRKPVELTQARGLPPLPPLPSTGIPAGLIERRPDLRSARHRLEAADRDLASAISSRLPRVSISASAQTIENDSLSLFEDWVASLAGNLTAPLLDGGRRRAEVERTEAVKNRLLYEYAAAALEALREVEDALAEEASEAERLENLENRTRLARESYEQLRAEYLNGVGDYIDVLLARSELQSLRRELITTKLRLLDFRIALYRSLAGGFETPLEKDGRKTEKGETGK